MFKFTSRVRFSETDESGNLSLEACLSYLQDCCLFQAESLGIGPDYLRQHDRLWMLSGWQVIIERYPKMFENIVIGTAAYDFTGCFGLRNVLIWDESGDCIVRANSPWVYVNTQTGKPERPDPFEVKAYGTEERVQMDYAPRKIAVPKEMVEREPVHIKQHFIDSNHHVNNVQYVQIARELTEKTDPVRELRVEYKKSALYGEILYPKSGEKDGWDYVTLENKDGQTCAIVALRFTNLLE